MRFTFIAFIAFMFATAMDRETKKEERQEMQMLDVVFIFLW